MRGIVGYIGSNFAEIVVDGLKRPGQTLEDLE